MNNIPSLCLLILACTLGASTACAPRDARPSPSAAPAPSPSPAPAPAATVDYADPLPLPPDLDLTPPGRQAIQVLGHAQAFGGHAVGYSGEPLPEVVALRALLAEPHAAQALAVVMDHGTLPAQLMALSGLYYADHAEFARRLDRYKATTTPVPLAREGCSLDPREPLPASEIVQADGAVRFQGPHDTLTAWVRRNRVPDGTPFKRDIAGGGWPNELYGH